MNTGYFWQVKECDQRTRGKKFTSGFPLFPDAPFISDLLGFFNEDLNPEYDESIESCNQNGLSDLGNYLVNRLIDKKMLIEIDHTSVDAYTSIMNIVEARNYSGVVSSHGWEAKAKDGGLHENTVRLIRQGGYISPYSNNANVIRGRIQAIVNEIDQTAFFPGVGVSTDMGGLGGQVSPRSDSQSNPLTYPFVNEFGFVTERQVSGTRTFDFNKDGVAHYGLLADFIQDLREQLSPELYDTVMNSAEAYLQMWERSTANTSFGHVYD